MSDFKKWLKANEVTLNVASRQELAEMAWNAALATQQENPILNFCGRDVVEYDATIMLTLEIADTVKIDFDTDVIITIDHIQQKLNQNNIINIVDWLVASKEDNKVVELSSGDVIDFSDLSGKEGSGTRCQRSFYAIVKTSETHSRFIQVFEVVEQKSINENN